MNLNSEELLKGLPSELMAFLQNVRDLQFDQKPDYNYLRGLLRKMNTSKVPLEKLKMDYIYLLEKNHIINSNINKNDIINKHLLNNGESKKITESNTNNESYNNNNI